MHINIRIQTLEHNLTYPGDSIPRGSENLVGRLERGVQALPTGGLVIVAPLKKYLTRLRVPGLGFRGKSLQNFSLEVSLGLEHPCVL